jgi:hypothetical protein
VARRALNVSADAVKLALNRLSKQGLIAQPARGFYVIIPPEYRSLGCRCCSREIRQNERGQGTMSSPETGRSSSTRKSRRICDSSRLHTTATSTTQPPDFTGFATNPPERSADFGDGAVAGLSGLERVGISP